MITNHIDQLDCIPINNLTDIKTFLENSTLEKESIKNYINLNHDKLIKHITHINDYLALLECSETAIEELTKQDFIQNLITSLDDLLKVARLHDEAFNLLLESNEKFKNNFNNIETIVTACQALSEKESNEIGEMARFLKIVNAKNFIKTFDDYLSLIKANSDAGQILAHKNSIINLIDTPGKFLKILFANTTTAEILIDSHPQLISMLADTPQAELIKKYSKKIFNLIKKSSTLRPTKKILIDIDKTTSDLILINCKLKPASTYSNLFLQAVATRLSEEKWRDKLKLSTQAKQELGEAFIHYLSTEEISISNTVTEQIMLELVTNERIHHAIQIQNEREQTINNQISNLNYKVQSGNVDINEDLIQNSFEQMFKPYFIRNKINGYALLLSALTELPAQYLREDFNELILQLNCINHETPLENVIKKIIIHINTCDEIFKETSNLLCCIRPIGTNILDTNSQQTIEWKTAAYVLFYLSKNGIITNEQKIKFITQYRNESQSQKIDEITRAIWKEVNLLLPLDFNEWRQEHDGVFYFYAPQLVVANNHNNDLLTEKIAYCSP